MSEDMAGVKVSVSWKLAKYDGELPKDGEVKEPVEVLEGGDVNKGVNDGTD